MNVELSKKEIEAILAALDEAPPLTMAASGRAQLGKKLRAALNGRRLFSAEEAIAKGWVKGVRVNLFGKGARR